MRNATARACVSKVRMYKDKWGAPKMMLTDNGPQFRSVIWKRGLESLNIRPIFTAVRNPQGNPCERYIKVVGTGMRILCGNRHQSWHDHLGRIKHFINYNYNSTTKELPIEIQGKTNVMLDVETKIKYPVELQGTNWEQRCSELRQRLKHQADRRSKYHKVKLIEFEIGQKVLIRRVEISHRNKKKSANLYPLYMGRRKSAKE